MPPPYRKRSSLVATEAQCDPKKDAGDVSPAYENCPVLPEPSLPCLVLSCLKVRKYIGLACVAETSALNYGAVAPVANGLAGPRGGLHARTDWQRRLYRTDLGDTPTVFGPREP